MTVHFVLPNDIDDPANPTGGNVYDRRLCAGLTALGWDVREHAVAGDWPNPDRSERDHLNRRLAAVPDGAVVVLDGLVASSVPEVLAAHTMRLRLVVLVHMAFGDESPERFRRERAALESARAVVTTSDWSRHRLIDLYGLPAARVAVARPGVAPAVVAPGSDIGARLLCVGPVAPHKGHDVLIRALALLADLTWTCVCVGSLHRDPGFVADVRGQTEADGIADRISFVGPRTGPGLDTQYAAADLLVVASRGESYGMVVTEALARGLPAVATDVGGLPGALGWAADGRRPGLLVPVADAPALGGALRRWLTEPELRDRLRTAASGRRETLAGWASTAQAVANVLSDITMKVSAAR